MHSEVPFLVSRLDAVAQTITREWSVVHRSLSFFVVVVDFQFSSESQTLAFSCSHSGHVWVGPCHISGINGGT